MRKNLFTKAEEPRGYIEYIRSQMQIARSTLGNVAMITIASLALYGKSAAEVSWPAMGATLVHGGIVAGVACSAFADLARSCFKQLMLFGSPE